MTPDDDALRQALRDETDRHQWDGAEALASRVMADWRRDVGRALPLPAWQLAGGALHSRRPAVPRRWAAALLVAAAIAGLWVTHAGRDPALQQLRDVDVLAQMSAGVL